jgi:hypothetical protein
MKDYKEYLERINGEFLGEHYEITENDIIMCQKYVDFIEKTRDESQPKVGDILMYTNEHGDFYKSAHIDRIDEDGSAEICEQPYVPFIGYAKDNKNIICSTSRGAWCKLDTKKFKYVGKKLKKFCDWGHCGSCAHGAIYFTASVNVWEYKKDNKFGEYSTKDYKKQYISFLDKEQMEQRNTQYSILGDGIAWETTEDYENYKKLYNGVEFEGYWKNQKVLFTYKEKRMRINNFQYEMLPLKSYVILDNGSKYKAKVAKDNDSKTIIIFLNDDYKYEYNDFKEWQKIRNYSEVQ